MKRFLTGMFVLLFLVACANNEVIGNDTEHEQTDPPEPQTNEEANETNNEEPTSEEQQDGNDVDYTKFFKPDESNAHFLGEGNEFATFTIHTKWLSENYVALVEDNGGAVMQRIYRVLDEEEKIDKVYEQLVEGLPDEVQYPSIEELESLSGIETYLSGPIEVGTQFGNWKIVETGTTLDTPFQTFNDVFVIEEATEEYVNRKYFVEGYGEIKREAIMQVDGDEEFIVTSTLEKIETK